MIQKALSKDQIDEVISLSREFRRPSSPGESKLPLAVLNPEIRLTDLLQLSICVYPGLRLENARASESLRSI